MLFNCACRFCGFHVAHSKAACLTSQNWAQALHRDEAQALTAGAAKLIGLHGLALTHPLWLPVPCLLPCPRHTQEQLRSSDTGKAPLKKPPHQNCCPEKNFNDKFHFMDPMVLLVCGCYCQEMWFEAVTTPLTPKGLLCRGHCNIKKQIT